MIVPTCFLPQSSYIHNRCAFSQSWHVLLHHSQLLEEDSTAMRLNTEKVRSVPRTIAHLQTSVMSTQILRVLVNLQSLCNNRLYFFSSTWTLWATYFGHFCNHSSQHVAVPLLSCCIEYITNRSLFSTWTFPWQAYMYTPCCCLPYLKLLERQPRR